MPEIWRPSLKGQCAKHATRYRLIYPGTKIGLSGRSFQPQGRSQQALAAVEDNELVRPQRLCCNDMQDINAAGSHDRGRPVAFSSLVPCPNSVLCRIIWKYFIVY